MLARLITLLPTQPPPPGGHQALVLSRTCKPSNPSPLTLQQQGPKLLRETSMPQKDLMVQQKPGKGLMVPQKPGIGRLDQFSRSRYREPVINSKGEEEESPANQAARGATCVAIGLLAEREQCLLSKTPNAITPDSTHSYRLASHQMCSDQSV